MGKFKDKNGKSRVGAFLDKIGKPVSHVLDIAGDVTGIDALKSISDAINKDETLTAEEKAIALELAQLDFQDRDSARDMQKTAIQSDDWLTRNFANLLASFIVLSATAFGIMLFFIEIPSENKRLVELFSDIYLFGGAVTVIGFYFGSSQGSKIKDKIKGIF